MDLKKKSWGEITLNDYSRAMEIIDDEVMGDTEKDIALIALLCEVDEQEIWNMNIEDVIELKRKTMFLTTGFIPSNVNNFKRIKIGEWECEVLPDLQKMTYAQFMDFQTYIREKDKRGYPKNRAAILSTLLIPKGKKYCDGYDIIELQKAIGENVTILVYNAIWSFFLQRSGSLLKRIATSLAYKLKAMTFLMKKKNPLRAKYRELAETLMQVRDFGG